MANAFRQTLIRLLGKAPIRAALQPRILERVPLQGLVREKVSYCVEPGQRVSAYVFLPEGEGPRPAALCIHQHNREYHLGKSEPAGLSGNPEQYYALELAKRGYVTLAPDALCFEERQHPILRAAVVEVDEYFRGKRSEFSVPLIFRGTDFQIAIWRRLVRIPYGQTATYSDLARAVGRPRAMRAVGQANHRNPISIVIPCHRVVGSDGRLVGYGGGLWRKEWLLEHEKKHSAGLPGPR